MVSAPPILMALPLPEALLLGLVEGTTEVFPISSDGHLALVRMLFGSEASPAAAFFLHIATLLATLLVLKKRAQSAWGEGLRGVLRPSLLKDTQGGRDATAVALATLSTAVVGLLLKAPSEACSGSPSILGVCLLGSALAIGSTYLAPPGEKDTPTHWGALLCGVAQGAAILPGVSRSATTLAVLLWLGMRGQRAFELSFLMSIPALAGGAILAAHQGFGGDESAWAVVLSTCVAFVAALGALRVLRTMVIRNTVAGFAIYLLPLGLAAVAWGYARPQ
jgi:undecaprenyl-diphosphatase